jgi:hypothetical protein
MSRAHKTHEPFFKVLRKIHTLKEMRRTVEMENKGTRRSQSVAANSASRCLLTLWSTCTVSFTCRQRSSQIKNIRCENQNFKMSEALVAF